MSLQYIIDAYNVINHPAFRHKTNKRIEDRRVGLLNLIKAARLAGSPRNRAIVIFDGYADLGINDTSFNNIKVVFSRKESADQRIKRLVEKFSNPKNVVVVSDDKEIVFFVKSIGAKTMPVEEFLKPEDFTGKRSNDSDTIKPELGFSAKESINRELRDLWLR